MAGGATSLRRAGAAYRLSVQGRLSPSGQSLVVADEHLPALLLAAEPALAAELARSRLAPLDALAAGPRERLADTLRAWLDRPGQVQAVAAALDVHPQTVRYRLKQLRELFGARLEDPGGAVRARARAARRRRHSLHLAAMRLLVTGAAGMLGTDVVATAAAGHDVVAFTRAELDITDTEAVHAAVRDTAPGRDHQLRGLDRRRRRGDRRGRRNADQRRRRRATWPRRPSEVGAHIVHVSTDYVFPGDATTPYPEDAPTGPIGAYGRSKLAGELAVAARPRPLRSSARRGCSGRTARTSSTRCSGSARERDEVTVVDDQLGCPTYTGHLAAALVQVAEQRTRGVLHVAGGGQCTWWDLAVATFAAAGLSVRVNRGTTAEFGRAGAAARVLCPRLDPLRRARAAVVAGGPRTLI